MNGEDQYDDTGISDYFEGVDPNEYSLFPEISDALHEKENEASQHFRESEITAAPYSSKSPLPETEDWIKGSPSSSESSLPETEDRIETEPSSSEISLSETEDWIKAAPSSRKRPLSETEDWMSLVEKWNEDFCALHNYPPTVFPTAEAVKVVSGQLYAIQVPLMSKRVIEGENRRLSEITEVFVRMTCGENYFLVCKENYRYVMFATQKSACITPALVRILALDSNTSLCPELPLRVNNQLILCATSDIKYQLRLFPSNIAAENLVTTPSYYVVPLKFDINHKDELTVACKLGATMQLRFVLNLGTSKFRLVNIVTTPVQIIEHLAYPELTQETELWKTQVHRLNQDIRLVTGYQPAKFLEVKDVYEKFVLESQSQYAFRLPANYECVVTGRSHQTDKITVAVTPGFSYLVIRRTNELWTFKCRDLNLPQAPPALIRILTVDKYERCFIPFRCNVPCLVLLRSGNNVKYRLVMLPPDFERRLLFNLDILDDPINVEVTASEQCLRMEMIREYNVKVVPDVQTATVYVSDVYGTADMEMRRMAFYSRPQTNYKVIPDEHSYSDSGSQ